MHYSVKKPIEKTFFAKNFSVQKFLAGRLRAIRPPTLVGYVINFPV